ncbi:hypothetical protein IH992_32105, partial [Candidatus Poribacteria bacterium]|nr:hypothetical protein [Candidatus Poribacteria bacterium]
MQQIASKTPPLPDEIKKAAHERRLIVFLGAGISCAVGLLDWDKVKKNLINQANFPDNLKYELQNTEIYACFEAVYRKDPTTYKQILDSALSSNKANGNEFRRLLDVFKLLKPVSIVTTNVDNLLLECGIFQPEQFRYMEECAP